MNLIQSHAIIGSIKVITGLHIGAGKDAIEIGGVDSPVVKNPYTGEPYIPGSSLKGKMRCLLEWISGRIERDGKPWEGGGENEPGKLAADPVLRIFGTTHKNWKFGPSRLVVRDAYLNTAWRDSIIERGLSFTEEKFENNIDRIQGKAGIGIRKIERVPAGALFDFQFVYRVFDLGDGGETDKTNMNLLFKVMRLLEHDALGGSGSRGYGRVKFTDLKLDGRDIQEDFDNVDPTELKPNVRAA
ncbi:MAG: type III-A CRISPR-associated RAMP protein Csm3 [Desulfobacterales bacterium]